MIVDNFIGPWHGQDFETYMKNRKHDRETITQQGSSTDSVLDMGQESFVEKNL